MIAPRIVAAAVGTLAAAGAAVALAASGPAPPKPPKPGTKGISCSVPERTPEPSTRTPSQALLDTLGVLRRPHAPEDVVPPAALRQPLPVGGVMLGAARRVLTSPVGAAWIVPVEDVRALPALPARCLRQLPAAQRERVRREQQRAAARPPVEGVELATTGTGLGLYGRWSVADIHAGKTFRVDNCAGAQHAQLAVSGLVPDGVTSVTVTARDGSMTRATPDQNLVAMLLARPQRPNGLPAHVTLTTAGGPRTLALQATNGLTQPCEPPSAVGNGNRVATPIALDRPAGAQIELETSRWEAEDTLPLLAGATYRRAGKRCLMIASQAQLRRRPPTRRLCVSNHRLRAERYVARARRLPSGDLVLEGFADPAQVSYIVVEHGPGGGAHALRLARSSGAFFLAVRAGQPGHTFTLHAALRGRPVRYTHQVTITLR